MKKLSDIFIKQLNTTSELESNYKINDHLGLKPIMNFDIWKDGCFLIECKQNIKSVNNGLGKAQKELNNYISKLKNNGLKLPSKILILDYEEKKLYDIYGNYYSDLKNFDFDCQEDIVNYDITFENGSNIAQQIYLRYGSKINDSNIFDHFKKGIDWYNPTNLSHTDFRLVLDLFNDPQTQKKRGAFYTPDEYIHKSTDYLRKAISKVPIDKDYVILDRCAGSGQLQKYLSDEELSHCVVSTLGIAEWISLWNIYGDKVRAIIPPYIKGKRIDEKTKPEELFKQVNFEKNEIIGANALNEEFYENNKHLWEDKFIIMLENPPYADSTSNMFKKSSKGDSNQTWIKTKMLEVGGGC